MDLLKAEIERKKRAAEAAKKSASSSGATVAVGSGGASRYMKASDLRRLQEEKEAEEERRQREEAENKKKKKKKKRQRDGGGGSSSEKGGESTASRASPSNGGTGDGDNMCKTGTKVARGGTGNSDASKSDENSSSRDTGSGSKRQKHDKLREELKKLTPADVTARLRSLGLPVRLFGEKTHKLQKQTEGAAAEYDDAQRIDRLCNALERQRTEMAGLSELDEFRLGSGYGIRNPFLDRRGGAADVGAGAAGSAAAASSATGAGLKSDKSSSLGAKKIGGEDDASDGKMGKGNAGTKSKEDGDGEDEDDPHKKIHKFFKSLLKQWEDDLAHRPDSVKHTAAGRNETKTYKQCKDYIRPLFKMCKSRRLEPGIMAHILNIVTYCEQGEFVKANDAYIDVAIGRASWPIGVTMVGIHARSGREKIGSSNVAHVMNNELQRKYLTSVKRLVSYCQKKRTDVDPSKKVW